jgi:hypothetical protein
MAASALTIKPIGNVYVDQPWLLMRWDSIHQHVHSEWMAFANSVEIRASLLKGIEAIRANSAVAYVSDARNIRVLAHADQAWIKQTWKAWQKRRSRSWPNQSPSGSTRRFRPTPLDWRWIPARLAGWSGLGQI